MKKALLIVFCAVFLLSPFSLFSSAAVSMAAFTCEKPNIEADDVDAFFVNPTVGLRIYDVVALSQHILSGQNANSTLFLQETTSYQLNFTVENYTYNSEAGLLFKFYIINLSPTDSLLVTCHFVGRNYYTGLSTYTVPVDLTYTPFYLNQIFISYYNMNTYGFYSEGFSYDLSYDSTVVPSSLVPANVIFGSDKTIHDDITNVKNTVQTLLNNIYTELQSIYNINQIQNTNFGNFYDLFNNYMDTLNYYVSHTYQEIADANIWEIHNWTNFIMQYLRDFVGVYFPDYCDEIYARLDQIIDILNGDEEEVTISDDMSAYEEMQSARDNLQVTDSNGQPIDAAAQVEIAFSEAASGIGDLGNGVGSINQMITQLLGTYPIIIVPLVVALALGLVVTILGKNKSD